MELMLRTGFVGIIVEQKDQISGVNRILSLFSAIIQGRIGVPNHEDHTAVIGIIVQGTNDQIGSLTGKLGNLPGITVKSALSSKVKQKGEKEK